MGHDGLVERCRHVVDAFNLGWTAGIKDVGLQDVGVAYVDQLLEPPAKRVLLACRYGDIQRVGDLP